MRKSVDLFVTGEDIAVVKQLTMERLAGFKQNKFRDRLTDKGIDPVKNEGYGVLSEYMVCKYLELDPKEHVNTVKMDHGVDLKIGYKTIQIKWTYYRTGRFFLQPWQPFSTDIGILTTPGSTNEHLRIAGWISKGEFAAKNTCKPLGRHGSPPGVDQGQLNAMPLLDKYLTAQVQ